MNMTGKWVIQVRRGSKWVSVQDADTRAEARRFAQAEVGVPFRIVACVNACEGFPSDWLEDGGIKKTNDALLVAQAENQRLKADNKKMRKALENAIQELPIVSAEFSECLAALAGKP